MAPRGLRNQLKMKSVSLYDPMSLRPVTSEVAGSSTILCFSSTSLPGSSPKSSCPVASQVILPRKLAKPTSDTGNASGACSFLDARAMTYSPNGWAFGWADSASTIGGRRQSQLSRASKPLRDCGWSLTAWSTHRRPSFRAVSVTRLQPLCYLRFLAGSGLGAVREVDERSSPLANSPAALTELRAASPAAIHNTRR